MIILLASFLLFWNHADVDSFRVYQDGVRAAATADTFYIMHIDLDAGTVTPVPAYRTSFHITSVRGPLESAPSLTLTGEYADMSDAEFSFTATRAKGERYISLVSLPAPEAAWIVDGDVLVCRADYDGNDAVLLPDLAAFGMYYRAGAMQADLNGDGAIDLSDFAAFGNLYQWRE